MHVCVSTESSVAVYRHLRYMATSAHTVVLLLLTQDDCNAKQTLVVHACVHTYGCCLTQALVLLL
jgi:hypothetical protein